jgi:hypothetical protein
MKMLQKNNGCSAMTLIEGLILICVALIGIYLIVRYQKNGEIFQISWHKTNVQKTEIKTSPDTKTLQRIAPIAPPSMATNSITEHANILINITQQVVGSASTPSVNMGAQFVDRRRQTVLILTNVVTNAAWHSAAARKGPGVRIAFP